MTPGKTITFIPGAGTGQNKREVASVDRLRETFKLHGLPPYPFAPEDTTAGAETELQAAVRGAKTACDLPLTIEQSNYMANIVRRSMAGDTPRTVVHELERFLNDSKGVWENSWVRFPKSALSPFAAEVLKRDLLADKNDPGSGLRNDHANFSVHSDGREFCRVPISYLVKLALADVVGTDDIHPLIRRTGERLLDHFLSDNTSPETHSFYIVNGTRRTGPGRELALETTKRYLLTQLLVMYANEKFQLKAHGQEAIIYFSPHPPVRQRKLNDCISDSFYRELFMSPCLSGWEKGEEKQEYMGLCHQVLSRSQLNAVSKLRDAGIITSNLVVLPNISNISLANNGTHVSLGSNSLTELLRDPSSGFGNREEKHYGDLAIKVVEHFLPLFVGTYSAAPYRLDFADLHPESTLGFLPHEMDYTHLRMLWRRWKKKATRSFFGHPITPFGPPWIDRAVAASLRIRGDYVPDFRLIDYLVCLLSTEQSPALNGICGNSDSLKKDLAHLGVFDTRMSLYLLYKLREFDGVGFSGFEGRHYSLFPSLRDDMADAVDMQNLITAFAYKLILAGDVTHNDIPDAPFVESERRQIFFGSAIGIPTFFVRSDTGNRFLRSIIETTQKVRNSHRYPGYLRVHNREYCASLLALLERDAADLIELFQMQPAFARLRAMVHDTASSRASSRLDRGILGVEGGRSPYHLDAEAFNTSAEKFYRTTLRRRHIAEAFDAIEDDLNRILAPSSRGRQRAGRLLFGLVPPARTISYIQDMRKAVSQGAISLPDLTKLICIVLIVVLLQTSSSMIFDGYEETGT